MEDGTTIKFSILVCSIETVNTNDEMFHTVLRTLDCNSNEVISRESNEDACG